ncbi:GYF domain-containing protein, partial [uncultured Duncaniella sp.]|uniref:GYF domain-containing protein n=1 Tax=uncultured Duncaniella sp. TaxID=2768039 RepID=UPI00272D00AD
MIMDRYYYLSPDKTVQGPILPSEFKQYGLNADSQVCREGAEQWVALRKMPELLVYLEYGSGVQADGTPQSPQPGYGQQPGYCQPQPGYGQQPGY